METGRTHQVGNSQLFELLSGVSIVDDRFNIEELFPMWCVQIRVHAQHLGHPVLGDEQYGGTEGAVLSRLTARLPPSKHSKARQLVSRIERPCLHALTIGYLTDITLMWLARSC